MKKRILFLTLLSFSLNANAIQDSSKDILNKTYLIKEYEEMFKKISQKRVGLDENEISKVKEPFLTIKKKETDKKKNSIKVSNQQTDSLFLEAIFNKKAMINGKWYSLYQTIGNKKIISISNDYVWLKTLSGKEKLTIRTKNANISIK